MNTKRLLFFLGCFSEEMQRAGIDYDDDFDHETMSFNDSQTQLYFSLYAGTLVNVTATREAMAKEYESHKY